MIDAIFREYEYLEPFFAACRARAVTQPGTKEPAPRWICGPYGRFRRFPATDDRKTAGDFERQAQNFPIQGMIADLVSTALFNLYEYRRLNPELLYKIVLQIHDAIVLLVRFDQVHRVVEEVLPECLIRRAPIYPCFLDGTPTGGKPHYLGFDAEVYKFWGVHMLPHECHAIGVDPKYAGWRQVIPGDSSVLVNPEAFGPQLWYASDRRLHKPEN